MWILILLVVLLGILVVVLYNRLVNARNRVSTAWSDIDVQLQRRHDLVPNLVNAVEAYSGYERATLETVTALRRQAERASSVAERGAVEEQLASGMHKLIALAESYPDLKANENFLDLQNQLVETEDYLQFARRYYNASVRDYNTMIQSVPSNLIAAAFGFSEREFFQKTSDDAANVPLVDLGRVE